MNAKKIEELYAYPERLNASELAMPKQAVSDFPYAAPLQALYMKALQQQESYLLPAQVKRTAIATPNREALKVYFDSHTSIASSTEGELSDVAITSPIEKIAASPIPAEVVKKTPAAKKKKTKKASAPPAPKTKVTKPVAPKNMIDTTRNILERSGLNLGNMRETIRTSHDGARTFVQYKLPEHTYQTVDGDSAALSLLAITSFDGTWPYD